MHKKYNSLKKILSIFSFSVLYILILEFFNNNTLMAKEKDKFSSDDINTINTQISDNSVYFIKYGLFLILTGFILYLMFFYMKNADINSSNLSIDEILKLISELLNQELDAPKSSVTRRIGHINKNIDYFIATFNPNDFENLDAIIKVLLEIIRNSGKGG
jgi:hypothetical protein